jgi:hypothetical protein
LRTQQQSDYQNEAPEGGAPINALRLWLASGFHRFAVDPRRRLGSHGRARKVLTEDPRTGPASGGTWQSLASTLDRHTVRGGMTELSPQELRVITLAYLEGRTNREIAAITGVSVSTVRRRLWLALERLDAYISRTGTWLSAILVFAGAYVLGHATRLARPANVAWSSDWAHKLVLTAAVAAVGLAAVSPDTIHPGGSPAATPPQTRASSPNLDNVIVAPKRTENLGPAQTASIVPAELSHREVGPRVDPPPPVRTVTPKHTGRGCGGKPTSAPPRVPVGRHSGGSPVSHPGKGGCHA